MASGRGKKSVSRMIMVNLRGENCLALLLLLDGQKAACGGREKSGKQVKRTTIVRNTNGGSPGLFPFSVLTKRA